MCNVSMVMDMYQPYVPQQWPPVYPTPITPAPGGRQPTTDAELRELIESFKEALKAAQQFDRATAQPDCVDPEKEKLIERVAELEARLDEIAKAASA